MPTEEAISLKINLDLSRKTHNTFYPLIKYTLNKQI